MPPRRTDHLFQAEQNADIVILAARYRPHFLARFLRNGQIHLYLPLVGCI